jgi:hypothetical protein
VLFQFLYALLFSSHIVVALTFVHFTLLRLSHVLYDPLFLHISCLHCRHCRFVGRLFILSMFVTQLALHLSLALRFVFEKKKAMACIHCWKHVGRRYCDECFLWWAAHTTQWQLWSVVQSRCTETLAARVCQDEGLGKLVCSFFVPTSSFVVHTGSRDVSLSTSARRLGKLYGLKVVPCVLQRLVIDFGDDPEYLHNKGFSIVACDKRSHMITLAELSK